jgi:hypothetical protein
MPLALRWSLVSLLGVLGLAGLVQLPLAPPLASRTGAATERVLADLASQESSQDARQRAAAVLSRFVGGEITRYFWGGFSAYLDVLGVEAPEDMRASIQQTSDAVQLLLVPQSGSERYVARVVAEDSVPRGLACRGTGAPGAFGRRGDALLCPQGWQVLPLQSPQRRQS